MRRGRRLPPGTSPGRWRDPRPTTRRRRTLTYLRRTIPLPFARRPPGASHHPTRRRARDARPVREAAQHPSRLFGEKPRVALAPRGSNIATRVRRRAARGAGRVGTRTSRRGSTGPTRSTRAPSSMWQETVGYAWRVVQVRPSGARRFWPQSDRGKVDETKSGGVDGAQLIQ